MNIIAGHVVKSAIIAEHVPKRLRYNQTIQSHAIKDTGEELSSSFIDAGYVGKMDIIAGLVLGRQKYSQIVKL